MNRPLPKRGGGGKPEYPEKIPDNQFENRYHILEVKGLNRGYKYKPSINKSMNHVWQVRSHMSVVDGGGEL